MEGQHELGLLLSPMRRDEHPSKLDGSGLMELRSIDPGPLAGERGREIPGGRQREAVEAPVLTEKGTFGRLLSL